MHPACVRETELDYEEGLEIWKAGDPEGARDALRYALAACRDNLWIHVALGQIALEEFRDPTLARGHFEYAVELGRRTLPPQFAGRLPVNRPANRPFHDALEGLIRSLDALGRRRRFGRLAHPSRNGCRGRVRPGKTRHRDGPIQACEKGRRRRTAFFDSENFSDLQGSTDRDRTTAD